MKRLAGVALVGVAVALSCAKLERDAAPPPQEPPPVSVTTPEPSPATTRVPADEKPADPHEEGRMGKRDEGARNRRYAIKGPEQGGQAAAGPIGQPQAAPGLLPGSPPPEAPKPMPARGDDLAQDQEETVDAPKAAEFKQNIGDILSAPSAGEKRREASPRGAGAEGEPEAEKAEEAQKAEKTKPKEGKSLTLAEDDGTERHRDGDSVGDGLLQVNELDGRGGKDRFAATVEEEPAPVVDETRPEHFLPRMFYFENTYLGGNAAFTRRLLALDRVWGGGERPYAEAAGPRQPFDAPNGTGLALTVHLDRASFDKPGRAYLQVGLQGSPRYGWRRPPLDLVVVIDAALLAEAREAVDQLARAALKRLEPPDRLALVLAGPEPRVLLDLSGPRDLRTLLAPVLDALPATAEPGTPGALGAAVHLAGQRLRDAAGNQARIPGAQEVLVLARGADAERVPAAAAAAHDIGVAGIITSAIRFDQPGAEAEAGALAFWDIAQAGQGNLRSLRPGESAAQALADELADLSRVVARLIRVNIRLGPRVEAIRVLGSRMLDRAEVARVKAREEAVDRNLSKTLGVKADRGLDDDGVQTVIPYFYGGDAHVMAVELWIDGPGPVADVSLKYKDMVNLGNATARASATLPAVPRPLTGAERLVRRNIEVFLAAELLAQAAARLDAGDPAGAEALVRRAAEVSRAPEARGMVAPLRRVLDTGADPSVQSEALRLAAARAVGVFPSR